MLVNFAEVFLSFLEALAQCFLMHLPTVMKCSISAAI